MFTLGLMNIHQLISIPRTIWTWVCSPYMCVMVAIGPRASDLWHNQGYLIYIYMEQNLIEIC